MNDLYFSLTTHLMLLLTSAAEFQHGPYGRSKAYSICNEYNSIIPASADDCIRYHVFKYLDNYYVLDSDHFEAALSYRTRIKRLKKEIKK